MTSADWSTNGSCIWPEPNSSPTVFMPPTLIASCFGMCFLLMPELARGWGCPAALIAVVLCEVAVLAFNSMRCPLTDVAGRYTAERQANFDIYLPLWLARHNQRIFGTLYAAGVAYTAAAWWARLLLWH